jgi:class 3 adenylate cyclase
MMTLDEILDAAKVDTDGLLAKNPPVEDKEDLDADELPDAAGETWYRVEDIVAVFVDLQNSTQLSVGKHPASTAAIYRAAMNNAVMVLHEFSADFIQIQGDGAFGLFWGPRAIERAMCAGITVRTYSEGTLEPALEAKWPDAPQTGFKVGIASGRVLVKKVGTRRNANEQEPIWAGKPVNYAAKAAQQANRGELIVTGTVWVAIEDNDYLVSSCGHAGGEPSQVAPLWEDVYIDRISHDEDDAAGRVLRATWCTHCGPAFVEAILNGETERPAAVDVHSEAKTTDDRVLATKWARIRDDQARRRGLRRMRAS